MKTKKEDYPIFTKWIILLNLIMDRAEGFPKSMRYSLTNRILNIANNILELLIMVIYSKEKISDLNKINLELEKLRIYFRICEQRKFLSHDQHFRLAAEINEFGRMVGGWIKREREHLVPNSNQRSNPTT